MRGIINLFWPLKKICWNHNTKTCKNPSNTQICHLSDLLIFRAFPIYLEPEVHRDLIYWQLGATGSKYRELEDQGLARLPRGSPDASDGARNDFRPGHGELLWKPVNEFQSWCGIARKLPVASVALNFIGLKTYENILDNVQWSHISQSFLEHNIEHKSLYLNVPLEVRIKD